MNENTNRVINSIRMLGIDMINHAKSGHPGIVLGAAPIIYTLYANHMNININNDSWMNRDRFIMSAGHGSALLYATLYMAGYNISVDDLKNFRQEGSITPGHPEVDITPGVDMSTGPLGQGLSSAVGIALGERYLRNLINKEFKNHKLIDYYTYVLCGDGDLMEGVATEAASFAGTQKLDKLIVLYDSNDVCLDSKTDKTFTENTMNKYKAMGWQTIYVKNGENINAISRAIDKAKADTKRPTIIEIKTIIGKGSILEGQNAVHGKPLEETDINSIKTKLGYREAPFSVSKEAVKFFRTKISKRSSIKYNQWAAEYNKFKKSDNKTIQSLFNYFETGNLNVTFDLENFKLTNDYKEELRETNSKIMNIISTKTDLFIGGSADLSSSCKTNLLNSDELSFTNPSGKNIYFGVREHAMGAILNGLALSGLNVFGSTFLTFSDYIKPAIRMSALMDLPVTYIFTHDSIAIGEDGPTHQPIEQLGMLRLIPNLTVYRPADIYEVIGSWKKILNHQKPASLVINKNVMTIVPGTNSVDVSKGAYIVRKEKENIDGIIIATGSEVKTAVVAAEELFTKGLDIRVVSMPSVELFLEQGRSYYEELFPVGIKIIALEASNDNIWNRFVYDHSFIISVNDYGISAKKDDVLKHMNFNYEKIRNKIEKLLR